MEFVFISDTHTLHDMMKYPLPEGDVLVHCGDSLNVGSENDLKKFIYWFQNLKGFDTKIFIAGNHDRCFEDKPDWLSHYINEENLSQSDCVYLQDDFFIIEDPEFSRPIKIYGSPWQPRFFNWAFNVDRDKIHVHWEKIPEDTDILITHGPPQEILDVNPWGEPCGCSSLRFHVDTRVKPFIHAFGHIHTQPGYRIVGDTTFINAAICTDQYVPSNKPIVASLNEHDGTFIVNIKEPWNY